MQTKVILYALFFVLPSSRGCFKTPNIELPQASANPARGSRRDIRLPSHCANHNAHDHNDPRTDNHDSLHLYLYVYLSTIDLFEIWYVSERMLPVDIKAIRKFIKAKTKN